MLAIRMQRVGRKGRAMFRLVVQDSRRNPTSGKVVAYLGSYDPHAKTVKLDTEKATFYLEHGAQPSRRVKLILKAEKVKLPEWVSELKLKSRTVRHPEKRRSSRPAEEKAASVPMDGQTENQAAIEAKTETADA
jgi:small subunit ribosomal protein S16